MRNHFLRLTSSSTYRKTLYTYAVSIIVLTMVILGSMFGFFFVHMKNMNISNSQQLLSQMTDSSDRMRANVDNIMTIVANDSKTIQFLQESRDRLDNYYLFLRLRDFMASYSYVSDLSVINLDTQICIRAVGCDASDTANLTFAQDNLRIGLNVKSRTIVVAGKNVNVVTFLQYLPYQNCVIIVDLFPDWFQYPIGSSGIRTVYIIDSDGNAVTNNAREIEDGQSLAEKFYGLLENQKSNAVELVFNDSQKRQILFLAKSQGLDWWYIDVQDYSSFYQMFGNIMALFLGIELLFFAFVLLISVFFSRRLQKPLIQLVNKCRATVGMENTGESDELLFIDNAIAKVEHERYQNEKYVRAQFLCNLILGREMPFFVPRETIQALGKEFFAKYYCVLLIKICSLAKLPDTAYSKEFKIYRYTVCNLADEIFAESFQCKTVELDEDMVGMLFLLPESHVSDDYILYFKQLKEFVEKQVKITVSGSLGPIVPDQKQIFESYRKAKQYLDIGQSIRHEELIDSNDIMNASYKEKNEKLVQSIVEYVKLHYSDMDLSLKSISDHLGLSTTYLGRIFKSISGESFSVFLTNYRLEQSKIELLETAKTVSEIAERAGFANPTYYATVFKNAYGMTPSAFRSQSKSLDKT